MCLLASLVVHGIGVAWVAGAWEQMASGADQEIPDLETDNGRAPDEVRLGIESSSHATISWLGFADPTEHSAVESETDQAALTMAPVGAPEPPSSAVVAEAGPPSAAAPPIPASPDTTAEAAPPASEAAANPESEKAAPESADDTVDESAEMVVARTDEALAEPEQEIATAEQAEEFEEPEVPSEDDREADTEEEAEQTPEEAADSPAEAPSETASETPADTAVEAPPGDNPGADSLPGILSDRESSPTSKAVDLSISDWGKPAAGEGVQVKPVRPRFPDTLAVFRRELNARVLIRFGADGRVRDVEFDRETIKKRVRVLDTGSAEANRVLLNSVYNWTAEGSEIEALREQGKDETLLIRMDVRVRP